MGPMQDALQGKERGLVRAPQVQSRLQGLELEKTKTTPPYFQKKNQNKREGGYLCSKCQTGDCTIFSSFNLEAGEDGTYLSEIPAAVGATLGNNA